MTIRRSNDLHVMTLEQAVERENVADVVVDHKNLTPRQRFVTAVEVLDHRLFRFRQFGDDAMEEERRHVKQPLGGAHALEDDALGALAQAYLLSVRQVPARKDNDRQAP